MARTASIERTTSESSIRLSLDLDGTGASSISTTVPFYDHMLTAFAKHSLIDLQVEASGDTDIDAHHTVEDTAISLGLALAEALGDKAGVRRYGMYESTKHYVANVLALKKKVARGWNPA